MDIDTAVKQKLQYPDIYFTPEYGKACEYSDDAEWELCQYKDLIYVYLKRHIVFENNIYYDLITPYGYSGYYFEKDETLKEFIQLFRIEAKKKNYITEVVKQNPYLDINISEYYEKITSKAIFSVEIDNLDNYLVNDLKSSERNIIKKANKLNYSYEIMAIKGNMLNEYFIDLYNSTMDKVIANKYYRFNNDYYKQIENIKRTFLINIYDIKKQIIGSSILFTYKDFVHYHLSCSDKSSNCITNYLLNNVVKDLGINKKFILGGGLKNNDSLYNFKKKISTNKYNYTIFKNVLNQKIYDSLSQKNDENYFPNYRVI